MLGSGNCFDGVEELCFKLDGSSICDVNLVGIKYFSPLSTSLLRCDHLSYENFVFVDPNCIQILAPTEIRPDKGDTSEPDRLGLGALKRTKLLIKFIVKQLLIKKTRFYQIIL